MVFKLSDMVGSNPGDRIDGAFVRKKINLIFDGQADVTIDFGGVETISRSFADEFFAKLVVEHPFNEVSRKIKFLNATPFIASVINTACLDRVAEVEIVS